MPDTGMLLVWQVENEFGKFGDILEKTKKKLDEACDSIDTTAVKFAA